jgi:hypothetical protein
MKGRLGHARVIAVIAGVGLAASIAVGLAPVGGARTATATTVGPPAATDAPASPRAPAPRIVVEPASFDFGTLRPARVVQKEFMLLNHGRADLLVDSIVSSCGCTAAKLETQVLKPGESTPLRIILTAPDEPGRLQKSVLVKSNDPAQPTLVVKILAVVVASPRPTAH